MRRGSIDFSNSYHVLAGTYTAGSWAGGFNPTPLPPTTNHAIDRVKHRSMLWL